MRNETEKANPLLVKFIIVGVIFLIINCGLLIYGTLFPKYIVHGESMEPTLVNDEIVQVSKLSEPERFDVVVLHPPTDLEETYIKRVIGLPGESVSYLDGQLYINNVAVSDSFSSITNNFTTKELFGTDQIPANCYFVLGDNREISLDSRTFGLVTQEEIIGIIGG